MIESLLKQKEYMRKKINKSKLFLFLPVLILSCTTVQVETIEKKYPETTDNGEPLIETEYPETTDNDEPLIEKEYPETADTGEPLLEKETIPEEKIDPITSLIKTLTLEEKVGQLFFINVRTEDGSASYTSMNDILEERFNRIKPGGILLFGDNIKTITQVTSFIEKMQNESEIPLYISADVEGGSINRLRSSDKMHATALPSNDVIGKDYTMRAAEIKAEIIGRELFSLGINLNLAPVADILTNPLNTVIGPRSFGSDPLIVSEMIATSVKAMRKSGIGTVLKHYPGHGDTIKDTHLGTVSVPFDEKRLKSVELLPFLSGISAGTDGIMTAHIMVPNVTGNDLPATLSPVMINDLLRDDLGYDRLILTDSLRMGAITGRWSPGEASIHAIKAGVDILLDPHDVEAAFDSILYAVQDGDISEERINESVYRILKNKLDLKIMDLEKQYVFHSNYYENPENILGSEEHHKAVKEINNQI